MLQESQGKPVLRGPRLLNLLLGDNIPEVGHHGKAPGSPQEMIIQLSAGSTRQIYTYSNKQPDRPLSDQGGFSGTLSCGGTALPPKPEVKSLPHQPGCRGSVGLQAAALNRLKDH